MPIGLGMLVALIVSVLAPPLDAAILVLDDHYILAFLLVAGWLAWLPLARRLLRWMLQGLDYRDL